MLTLNWPANALLNSRHFKLINIFSFIQENTSSCLSPIIYHFLNLIINYVLCFFSLFIVYFIGKSVEHIINNNNNEINFHDKNSDQNNGHKACV